MKSLARKFSLIALLPVICFLFVTAATAEEITVNSYYGVYDAAVKKPGFPSKSLKGPVTETWVSPKPKKGYHIGVLFPHLKDSYWIAANYGIISHAKALGLKITLLSAGGYSKFGNQMRQLRQLAEKEKVDGIVLASVDYKKMDKVIANALPSTLPVVELINDINCPTISAKSLLSFYEMGYKAGEFVVNDSAGKHIKVAFFPGPEKSGWAPDTYNGFKAAVDKLKKSGQKIALSPPQWGDTTPKDQGGRLLRYLGKKVNHKTDYIVGNAVAAVEAVAFLEKNKANHPKAKIVSTYITKTVHEQIKNGRIKASPSDQTVLQCKISLDMMVRLLNGEKTGDKFPFRVSPQIPLVTDENIAEYSAEKLFGDKNFKPVVN